MINGVINVRKEKGMTSFGVVSRMRRIFDQKKIGHTGTLDPDAEGVLPVCLGKATRLVETLSRGTKSYRAVLLLGMTTDTQDAGGTETPSDTAPDKEAGTERENRDEEKRAGEITEAEAAEQPGSPDPSDGEPEAGGASEAHSRTGSEKEAG